MVSAEEISRPVTRRPLHVGPRTRAAGWWPCGWAGLTDRVTQRFTPIRSVGPCSPGDADHIAGSSPGVWSARIWSAQVGRVPLLPAGRRQRRQRRRTARRTAGARRHSATGRSADHPAGPCAGAVCRWRPDGRTRSSDRRVQDALGRSPVGRLGWPRCDNGLTFSKHVATHGVLDEAAGGRRGMCPHATSMWRVADR